MKIYCLKCTKELKENTSCDCGSDTTITGVLVKNGIFYCLECGNKEFLWKESLEYTYKHVSVFRCKKFRCKNIITTSHLRIRRN